MSGVAAWLQVDGAPVRGTDAERMESALAPVGRDRVRSWTPEPGPVALAHSLSRITPEDDLERQPLLSAGGRWALVADCRLDNREELARSLGIPAAVAAKQPDGQLVLAALERWGTDCASHLLGAFSLIAWERREHTLWAAVDAVGEHALYIHSDAHRVLLSSWVPALFTMGVPRTVDLHELAARLADVPDPGATTIAGVRRLRAGHHLTVSADGAQTVQRFWHPDRISTMRLRDPREADEALLATFEAAVGARLRASGPVGAFCSGGLDSTSVASSAARQLATSGASLRTFTSVPDPAWDGEGRANWEDDDSPYVRALAGMRPNMTPTFVAPDGRTGLDYLGTIADAAGSHVRNVSNIPWIEQILAGAASHGIKVVLSGASGNATISWNGSTLLPALLRAGRLPTLARVARKRASDRGWSLWDVLRAELVVPSAPVRLRARRHLRGDETAEWDRRALFNPDLAGLGIDAVAVVARHQRTTNGRAQRLMMLDQLASGPNPAEGTLMRHGVVMRDPTADLRVLELFLSLPEISTRNLEGERLAARRALGGLLPPEIRNRTTRGSQAPDAWMRLVQQHAVMVDMVERITTSDTAQRLLDVPKLRSAVEQWPMTWSKQAVTAMTTVPRTIAAGMYVLWLEGEDITPRRRAPVGAGV